MSPREIKVYHLIMKGRIRRTEDNGVEILQHEKWRGLTRYLHPKSGRGKYYLCGGYIYANRLIWMLTWLRKIPDNNFVDHIDGDRTNDNPTNLRLHSKKESNRQGYEVQLDKTLDKLCRWFDAKIKDRVG